MIKVTLLGDSIRMIGYGPLVPALLGEDFEVFQPDENCRFAKYTLRGLFDWQGEMSGTQIVHWNNGLWDICNLFGDGLFTSESEYVIIIPFFSQYSCLILISSMNIMTIVFSR